MFKESLNKVNSKKYPHVLNLNSMRLGVNTIMKLISTLETHQYPRPHAASPTSTSPTTPSPSTACTQSRT